MGTYLVISDSCRTSTVENKRTFSLDFDPANSPDIYSDLCGDNDDGMVVPRSDNSDGFTSYGITINNSVYSVPCVGSSCTWSA